MPKKKTNAAARPHRKKVERLPITTDPAATLHQLASTLPAELLQELAKAIESKRWLVAAFHLNADNQIVLQWRSAQWPNGDYLLATMHLERELKLHLANLAQSLNSEAPNAN